MTRRQEVWLVGALTLAALWLRLIGIGGGLWFDEIVTLVESVRPSLYRIATEFPGYNNHPFYSLLAHLSVTAFGEHAWSLRLPAFAFGVASIPLLYWLGRVAAPQSRLEAFLGAGLLTVSYHHIWFSQNARGYTALLCWTLLATTLFIRGLEEKRPRWYVWHGFVVAIGTYTHLTMLFVAAAHGAIWVAALATGRGTVLRRGEWRLPALAVSIAGGLTAVLYSPIVLRVFEQVAGTPPATREVATTSWAVREMVAGLQIGFGTVGLLAVGVLAALGAASYWRHNRLVLMVFVLPGVTTLLGVFLLRFPLRPRFFFQLIGFAVLVLVRGALRSGAAAERVLLPERPAAGVAMGAGLVAVVGIVSVLSLPRGYEVPKQDFEGALQFVEARLHAGDVVATAGLATYPYRIYHKKTWTPLEYPGDLAALRRRTGRAWVIYSFPEYIHPGLVDALRDGCMPVRRFPASLRGGDVIVCRIDKPAVVVGSRSGVTSP